MEIIKWQDLEDAVEKYLKERIKKDNLFYQRFFDTKSAGNFLPPQPSDFLVVRTGRAFYIETKFSEVHDSLISCFSNAVSGNQTASARLVTRAGASYWFLFYSSQSGNYEVWDGNYCFDRRSMGKRLETAARSIHKTLNDAIAGGIFNGYRANLQRSTLRVTKKG